MNRLNKCSFEGSLMSDVKSKVHVSKCVGDTGTVDVSIMSKRVISTYLEIDSEVLVYVVGQSF